MDNAAIIQRLLSVELKASELAEECHQTRMLIIQDGVSTLSAGQPHVPGPLSEQELAAISAKRRKALEKQSRR